MVVLGTGWGGFSFFSALNPTGLKSLTIVSPRNYFLFTPLLPSVTTGTTEPRSIMEPVRSFVEAKRKKFPEVDINFLEMEVKDLDLAKNVALCEPAVTHAIEHLNRTLSYDIMVLAPGAKSNNFGTPGVDEYCHYLKEMPQARKIRNSILDAFETAHLCSDAKERQKLLHFVVVGGGPTGVEFAAELRDFIHEDLSSAYPSLAKDAKVTIVQAGDLLLNTFDKAISIFAEDNFKRIDINLMKNTAVTRVGPDTVFVENRVTKEKFEIPYGICVWAAGVAPRSITGKVIERIGGPQKGSRLLKTDPFMRVVGTENLYAIGDCSMIEQPDLAKNAEALYLKADINKDGMVSKEEAAVLLGTLLKQYPLIDTQAAEEALEADPRASFDKAGWFAFMKKLEGSFKSAPATAQVAQQQGEYLADYFAGETSEPWKRVDRGMMSYVGSSKAVMQTNYTGAVTGSATFSLWRGAYASKLFSWRCRHYVVWDWMKKVIYGRDISRM